MRTNIHTARNRDLWMVLGLVALAVGLPAIVGVVSGAVSIPHNDDFAYRRAATLLYETGRVELTGWAVMTRWSPAVSDVANMQRKNLLCLRVA